MTGKKFEKLIEIMSRLRGPDGCPWDREQTHCSLTTFLLEETYEVIESIESGGSDELKEELGDLLLQIVFHSQIAKEEKSFTIEDVIDTINKKLIRRHPHVFGIADIKSSEEQRVHWERIKKKEKGSSVLDGVPKTLPSLQRAYRVQQKASAVGFDWKDFKPAVNKVKEEFEEFEKALEEDDRDKISEELGDILFSIVNVSRFIRIDPEAALRKAVDKFIDRFKIIEKILEDKGKDLKDVSLEEMDKIWNQIKKERFN